MVYWLTGVPALADLALLVVRLVIGVMFALSGYFKLTDPQRRQKMADSLKSGGIPPALAPQFSAVELLGGLGVTFGLLTALAALGLLVIAVGALVTVIVPKAKGEGIHKLENLLYAPETLLAAGLLVLVAIGAGRWSLDYLVF